MMAGVGWEGAGSQLRADGLQGSTRWKRHGMDGLTALHYLFLGLAQESREQDQGWGTVNPDSLWSWACLPTVPTGT